MKDNDKKIQEKFLNFSDGEYNTSSGWQRLERRLPRSAKKINAIRLLVAAACFILIALPAYFFILKKRNTKQNAYTYQVYSPAKKALPKEKSTQLDSINSYTSGKESHKKTLVARIEKQNRNPQIEKKEIAGNKIPVSTALAPPAPRAETRIISSNIQKDIAVQSPAVSRAMVTISAEEADQLIAETIGTNTKRKSPGLHVSLKSPVHNNEIEKSSSTAALINF